MSSGSNPTVGISGRGSGLLDDERGRMQYLWMYKHFFDHPNWMMNLLTLVAVVLITGMPFIGIVAGIVNIGYHADLLERLHLRPDRLYVPFDFNKIKDYLIRGLWVFLSALIAGVAMSILVVPVTIIAFIVFVAASSMDPMLGIVVMVLMGLLLFAVIVALNSFMQPLFLRAALTQDFAKSFDMGYMKEFITLTWREMLVTSIWLAVSGFCLALLGLCACGVGTLFASALIVQAQWHGLYQLYELYLERGGKEIPLKTAGEV